MSIDPNLHPSMKLPAKYKILSYHFLINKGNTNPISVTRNYHTYKSLQDREIQSSKPLGGIRVCTSQGQGLLDT